MSLLTVNAINMRHGQIEDGPYWLKIGTLSEEIDKRNGFEGQQFIEFPVDAENAKRLATSLKGQLPASLDCTTGIKMVSGKPMMVIVNAEVTQ